MNIEFAKISIQDELYLIVHKDSNYYILIYDLVICKEVHKYIIEVKEPIKIDK